MRLASVTLIIIFIFAAALAPRARGANPIIVKFDHEMHVKAVFAPNKVECAACHNLVKKGDRLAPAATLVQATFNKPLQEVCHQCHKSQEAKWGKAPKACFTCHDSADRLSAIKPTSHLSAAWKQNHAAQARADGASCLECHANSQCVKCHARRDGIFPANHPRTYRYFHSVEARMAPQKCDACHTKSYCAQCHMGKGL